MPFYKYTVANKDGKKLSGTVEAPDEKIARNELNNLGFSILDLNEATQTTQTTDQTQQKKFIFEAIDKNSKHITGSIPSNEKEEALKKLEEEYDLTITAIWSKEATEQDIQKARQEGYEHLQYRLQQQEKIERTENKDIEQQKEEQFIKTKIEKILQQVYELLKTFDKDIEIDQKALINKKIDKLLRIKHSTNLQYILATAEELLRAIQEQETSLKEKGLKEKQLELGIKTKNLLKQLGTSSKAKTVSQDIVRKIEIWEAKHEGQETTSFTKFILQILNTIKPLFTTDPRILAIKEQIGIYNKQIIEFIKLYFKEATPEYKAKVSTAIKTLWETRKKTKQNLTQLKKQIKQEKLRAQQAEYPGIGNAPNSTQPRTFLDDLNLLTGWLLTFYIIYYFIALYITTKDFGFNYIPGGFFVYESGIFKYVLVIVFLFHASTSLKINFFRTSRTASLILFPLFIFGSIITLLNF